MSQPPLVERFQERKLVQWALAYLARAWVLLQVLDRLGPNFEGRCTIVRSATVVLRVGFFAVLVLAWYPGEKGHQRARGMEILVLSALLVIAGIAVTWVRGSTGVSGTCRRQIWRRSTARSASGTGPSLRSSRDAGIVLR